MTYPGVSVRYAGILLALVGACAGLSAQPVRVLLFDVTTLEHTLQRCAAKDKLLSPACGRLSRDAAKALGFEPVSVVEKDAVPPSGDKHDYLSWGKYWWPDPSRPDGLPYIRKDGQANPEAARIPDHEKFSKLVIAVQTLGLGYFQSRDEALARRGALLLRTWFLDPATRMNPRLDFAQAVPGRSEGRGTGIIDLHRFPDLLDAVGLIAMSEVWTSADRDGMQRWCAQYLEWLRFSANGKDEAAAKNNHGSWYDVQVTALALFLGQRDLAAQTVKDARTRRIAAQILPDGTQPEELARTRSLGYCLFNLQALFTLARLGETLGIDLWEYRTEDGRALQKAFDVLLPYLPGKQPWPHEQIIEVKRDEIYPLVLRAALRYKDARYLECLRELRDERTAMHRSNLLFGIPTGL